MRNWILVLGIPAMIISFTSSASASHCPSTPAGSPLPVMFNGFYLVNLNGPPTVTDGNGGVLMQGGLSLVLLMPAKQISVTFEGGSVGDIMVQSFAYDGSLLPQSTVPVGSAGANDFIIETDGVARLDLVSTNNEGNLMSVCSDA